MSVLDVPHLLFRGLMAWDPVTHRSVLFGASVTGVDLGDGVVRDDPVVGVPLSLTGMLVDADPDGPAGAQLFYDAFTVGVDGGCQVALTGARPFCSRPTGPASAVWQASVAEAGFAISAFDSVALARLQDEVDAGRADGITVRFTARRDEHHGGPARSLVVGVVGPWRCGEPVAEPGDRTLVPVGPAPLAPASARVVGSRLVVDLAGSLAETDPGPLDVRATTPGGTVVPLGPLIADGHGIAALPLDPAPLDAAATGTLDLVAGGRVVLRERELAAVATTPNLHLDEVALGDLDVRVLRRGRPVTAPTSVLVVRPGVADPVTVTTDDDGCASIPVDDAVGAWPWILLPYDGDPPAAPSALDPRTMGHATVRVLPRDQQLDALPPTWANVHRHVLAGWKAQAPCMDGWLDLADEAACARTARLIRQLTGVENHDRHRYMPVTRDLTVGQRTLLHRWCDEVTDAAAARLRKSSPGG